MALYKGTFENKYEANVTTTFEQKENVTVNGTSTLTYKNGLLIDASGQTFTTNDQTFTRNGDTVTRQYSHSFSLGVANFGAAASNISSANITATHARTRKTEVAGLYTLLYGLFVNPSPFKATNGKATYPYFLCAVDVYVLNKEKCETRERNENNKGYSYSGLTVLW